MPSQFSIDKKSLTEKMLRLVLGTMLDDYLLKPPGTIEFEDGIRKIYPKDEMSRMEAQYDGVCAFIEPWNVCRAAYQRRNRSKS